MKCIIFVADAVRPDYLGCYGDPVVNTSDIDYLAHHGIRFETVISAAPWTAPSTASIISGINAHKHRIFTWSRSFSEEVYTLFHAFSDHGYVVGSYVFDQDFMFSSMPFARVQGDTDRFDEVYKWIDRHAEDDFFLYIHSWATHTPYNVPHSDRERWKTAKQIYIQSLQNGNEETLNASRAAYRQAIEFSSANQIGRLLNLLQNRSILDQTLFVFTSDHGESWGERFTNKQQLTSLHSLHGHFLFDETLKVPLILHKPGSLPESMVVKQQVSSIDLAPTILDLADIPFPDSAHPLDGTSLVPLLDGKNHFDRPSYSSTSESGHLSRISIRVPPYKLIYTIDPPGAEFYDLSKDPQERHNLIKQTPDIAHQLQTMVETQLAGLPPEVISPDEEAAIIEQFQELGYL
jgi:arylsulfatase A-like enzyme